MNTSDLTNFGVLGVNVMLVFLFLKFITELVKRNEELYKSLLNSAIETIKENNVAVTKLTEVINELKNKSK